jgi:hypothetical protein
MFKNILLGHKVQVFTDDKSLMFKQFITERVMQWWLIIKELGPELIYIKGKHNIVADALSWLELTDKDKKINDLGKALNFEEEPPIDSFPLTYSCIAHEQHKDTAITNALANVTYSINTFDGEEKQWDLAIFNEKIVIPKDLQNNVVNWCHNQLCHPGMTLT